MRIGINTLYMIPDRVGGSETYLRGLIYGLSKIDTENEYILFTNKENHETINLTEKNFRKILCNVRAGLKVNRILYEQIMLPRLVREHAIDVLHSPGYVAPLMASCGSVITIYDLQYAYYPHFLSKTKLWYWKTYIPKSVRNADVIITLSNNSKADIVKHLGASDEKVYVTYADSRFNMDYHRVQPDESVLKKIGCDTKYILYVASPLPHKNIERLLYAFKKISGSIGHHLVLVGLSQQVSGSIMNIIENLDLRERVVLSGYVSDGELIALYRNAALFVFPSLFEGFGLPLVEAMNFGCPIAASDKTSNAEIVSDAGVLFDPENPEAMADAMYTLICDRTLAESLIEKGYRRAESFSWKSMARTTLQAYRRAYELRSR